MKANNYITINDAYQLVEGAKIRAKKYPEELFVLSSYDADKRGYLLYPFDEGRKFNDFGILITESELMYDYEIEKLNVNEPVIIEEAKAA
ncbi:hypothetical protein KXQ82_07290 [Mucilaginibacter sp. HMF5004]|uniref:hypothetical protein n=1 Tax=Mucilaginibacter rivuli TaxID=2857527 RepID=UPI001C5D3C8E|nr:hypothetical protein [Mucilaginibacter rivuli]MBW4889512.1 hypothetical protein [Mucilaginibacter rivuli]